MLRQTGSGAMSVSSRMRMVSGNRDLHTVSPIFSAPLEPLFSTRAREIIRTGYQQRYLDDLNTLTSGTPYENYHLEMLVKETAKLPKYAAVYNNAAQAWNNEFFFHIMVHPPSSSFLILRCYSHLCCSSSVAAHVENPSSTCLNLHFLSLSLSFSLSLLVLLCAVGVDHEEDPSISAGREEAHL